MSILISPSNEDNFPLSAVLFSRFRTFSLFVSGMSCIAALLFLDEADGLLKSVHELFKILFV